MATSRTVLLLRAFYIFDFGSQGNAVGIGRAAPQSGMEVGYPATFDDTVNLYSELQFNSEQAYPTFSRPVWTPSSDETELPVLPCEVVDENTAEAFWCDEDGVHRINHAGMTWGQLASRYTWGELAPEGSTPAGAYTYLISVDVATVAEAEAITDIDKPFLAYVQEDGGIYLCDSGGAEHIGYLPLSGGTMTGGISMNNDPIDRDGANPSSVQYGQNMVRYVDRDGELIGYIQPKRMTDGRIGIQLTAVNENSSGSSVYGSLSIYVDKSGTVTYETNSPANFRTAIGLTTSVTSSLTNTGVTITAKSGFTVTVTSVRSYGNVRTVFGNIKSTSAWTAGQQISPFSTNLYSSVVSSDFFYGDVASSGNAWLRVAVATSANTARDFTMVGIL